MIRCSVKSYKDMFQPKFLRFPEFFWMVGNTVKTIKGTCTREHLGMVYDFTYSWLYFASHFQIIGSQNSLISVYFWIMPVQNEP